MKKLLLFIPAALLTVACNSAAPTNVSNASVNSADRPLRAEQMNTIAHTTEGSPPPSSSKPAASGDPIDTAKFDGTIAEAEKALKATPNDETAKAALADAYFDRAFALTQARQYGSALGDYRRAIKLKPDHEDANKWIAQIESIYKMLNKEAPKVGEEPAPLPFEKQG